MLIPAGRRFTGLGQHAVKLIGNVQRVAAHAAVDCEADRVLPVGTNAVGAVGVGYNDASDIRNVQRLAVRLRND